MGGPDRADVGTADADPQGMTTTTTTQEPETVVPTGCCPPFDPSTWNEREVGWRNRPFVVEHVHSFLHIPLDMARKVARANEKIEAAHAAPTQALMLFDEKSLWGATLYIDVLKDVPGEEMASLSGTFLTKVYEGPFRDAGKWAEDMKRYVAAKGRTLEHLYYSYTTCPSCAKAYGHNYVVMFAKVDDAPSLAS
jgi:hypothetical protein